jgi:RHS repeat-associated protein
VTLAATGSAAPTNVSTRARVHHTGVGRWLSEDPLLGNPGDPMSFNRYLYTNANPVDYSDPTGLIPYVDHRPCDPRKTKAPEWYGAIGAGWIGVKGFILGSSVGLNSGASAGEGAPLVALVGGVVGAFSQGAMQYSWAAPNVEGYSEADASYCRFMNRVYAVVDALGHFVHDVPETTYEPPYAPTEWEKAHYAPSL